jgi:hypothetical protein
MTEVNRSDGRGHVDEREACRLLFDVCITVSLLICMAYGLNCCDANWHLSFCLLGIIKAPLMNRNDASCPIV